MACCALGALLIATVLMWWKRLRAAIPWRPFARGAEEELADVANAQLLPLGLRARGKPSWALVVPVLAASLVVSGLVARHLDHYVERARANERDLLAEIMAQPICTGPSLSAQATPSVTATSMDQRLR
jgi:hypothetical protein